MKTTKTKIGVFAEGQQESDDDEEEKPIDYLNVFDARIHFGIDKQDSLHHLPVQFRLGVAIFAPTFTIILHNATSTAHRSLVCGRRRSGMMV